MELENTKTGKKKKKAVDFLQSSSSMKHNPLTNLADYSRNHEQRLFSQNEQTYEGFTFIKTVDS